MKIISFSNQKGGAGKTTATRELSIYFAHTGLKVLIIDADPQGNISQSVTDEEFNGLYEALTGEDFQIKEIKPNLYLLSGDKKLSLLEKNLLGEIDAHVKLSELLEQNLFKEFDYIMIDCPPSLGVLTSNALTASNYIVIPMNPKLYTMQGTNLLMETISKVKKNLNKDLKILGVVINSYDKRAILYKQVKEEIQEAFSELVFKTAISTSVKVEEAIAQFKGIIELEDCKVKEQAFNLGEEFLNRLEGAGNEI